MAFLKTLPVRAYKKKIFKFPSDIRTHAHICAASSGSASGTGFLPIRKLRTRILLCVSSHTDQLHGLHLHHIAKRYCVDPHQTCVSSGASSCSSSFHCIELASGSSAQHLSDSFHTTDAHPRCERARYTYTRAYTCAEARGLALPEMRCRTPKTPVMPGCWLCSDASKQKTLMASVLVESSMIDGAHQLPREFLKASENLCRAPGLLLENSGA